MAMGVLPLLLAGANLAASPPAEITKPCQQVLDLWCNADGPCVAANKRGGFKLPLVARRDLQGHANLKCYSPSVLDKTKTKYTGGAGFCSMDGDLEAVLAVCNGTDPGAYPLPSSTGPAPTAGSCASPFLADANSTFVLQNSRDATDYRIPIVMRIPGTDIVLALAENRGDGHGDAGRHSLAVARSADAGKTFSSVQNIYNDSVGTIDGLNLGAAVWDVAAKRFKVLFNECFHLSAIGKGCGTAGQLLQIDTADNGLTWLPVVNHTESLLTQGYKQLNPGPGTGVQLQHQTDNTKNGRLLMPAWGSKTSDGHGAQTRAFVLISEPTEATAVDDGWRAVLVPPDTPEYVPNELQCAELADGTIVLNARSGNHPLRLLSSSTDGGDTWSPLALTPSMGTEAVCQGSMIAVRDALFFSHPFHATARRDGWIKFSLDGGGTWFPWAQVDPAAYGYSGLTLLSSNASRVELGVVWEGRDGIEFKAVSGLMPSATKH
jgi:hypothetical protein